MAEIEDNTTPGVALGLPKHWETINRAEITEVFPHCDSISILIERTAERIKSEEFGSNSAELSEYELKLVLAGLHLGEGIMNAKKAAAISSLFGGLGGLFGSNGPESDK